MSALIPFQINNNKKNRLIPAYPKISIFVRNRKISFFVEIKCFHLGNMTFNLIIKLNYNPAIEITFISFFAGIKYIHRGQDFLQS